MSSTLHAPEDFEDALHQAHSKRRNAVTGGVVALTLVVLWGGMIYRHVANEGALLPQTGTVHLPAVDASPRRVVATYIDALDVHDAATAYALSEPSARGMHASTTYYLQRLASVSSFRITSVIPGDGSLSGGPEVQVTWDLDWSRPNYLDQDGSQIWGFILRRNPHTGRWLISDQGTG